MFAVFGLRRMHWAKQLRIVSILVSSTALCLLVFGFAIRWYIALLLAAVMYLVVPVLFGLWWGLSLRRKQVRETEKLNERDWPRD
jgi:hypothetical protein